MTDEANAGLAIRLRAAAHEMLQMAEELEATPRRRASLVPDHEMASMTTLVALAAKWHTDRERRSQFFDSDLLGEPAWDMLLYLFVRSAEGHQVRKTALCGASGVAHATAMRYISLLQQHGLIVQTRCMTDARVQFVSMTQEGMVRMAACLARSLRERSSAARTAGLRLITAPGKKDIPTAN